MYTRILDMLGDNKSPVAIYEALGRKVALEQIEQMKMEFDGTWNK